MATHAYSTRTPLLRLSGSVLPLLPLGLGRQSGPVIIASGGPVSRAVQAGRGETLHGCRRDLRALAVAVLSVKGGRA